MSQREKSEAELYCEIKEAFQIFDRDNDGIITKEEEQTILRMFGINPHEKEDKTGKKEEKKTKEGEKEEEENGEEGEEGKTITGNNEEEKLEDQNSKIEYNNKLIQILKNTLNDLESKIKK